MKRHHLFTSLIFVVYIIVCSFLLIFLGIGITPDRYAFVLLAPVLFIKKARTHLLDWIPFLGLLITYDFLRGFAPYLNNHVNFAFPIQGDTGIFGVLPTAFLQAMFYQPGKLNWFDFVAAFAYFFHFAIPLAFALMLWLRRRSQFFEFTKGLLILSYAAWITFIAFPVAPPWLADQNGYITGITKILDQVLLVFPQRLHIPALYDNLNPNPVAAVPSLHAAYPFLVFLFALKFYGKSASWFLGYVFIVWLALIYLGEHYFTDIVLGMVYAILAYIAVQLLPKFRLVGSRLRLFSTKPA
jgi:hypothetical protein